MSLSIHGVGTSDSGMFMTQSEALSVSRGVNDRDGSLGPWLDGIFGHARIDRRSVCVPTAVLRDMADGTNHSGSPFVPDGPDDATGPTTAERMAVYWQVAAPMAVRAARAALEDAGADPQSITHLVTVTCTGFRAPGLDHALIRGLGLSAGVERTQVGFMGCHGAMNGLRVAKAFAGSDPAARVLTVAAEVCTVHYHYGPEAKRLVGNALFADGAGAVVGAADGPADAWTLAATGSCLLPDSERAMTWEVGDAGFEMVLSTKIPGVVASNLRPWLVAWLSKHGLTLGDIGSWAVHPGGPKVLTAVEESLCLPRGATDVSWGVLRDHGNMSSATVLYILQRLRQAGAPRPCVALGFGPGMAVEAGLFR